MTPDFKFSKEDGFTVAAAFVGDGDFQDNDPEIGEVKFLIKSWASSTDDVKFTELKKRKCRYDDF